MTGLEKMQSQILDEARRRADEILEQAEKEAREIREEAGKSAQAESSRILEKSRAEVKNIQERTLSSCALQRRQILLEAKQEIIARILEKAYHTLIEADEDTYFRIIRKMLEKYTAGQAGEICLCWYMGGSKRTAASGQCLIPEKMNSQMRFIRYYFHKREPQKEESV